jgi:hypothetical protein
MYRLVLDNSAKVADFARLNGCTIIHAPISFEKGHAEIADRPYGILASVKEGRAFTNGEWGADFAGNQQLTMRSDANFVAFDGKSVLTRYCLVLLLQCSPPPPPPPKKRKNDAKGR